MPRVVALFLTLASSVLLVGCGPDFQALSNQRLQRIMDLEGQVQSLETKVKTEQTTNLQLHAELEKSTPRIERLSEARLAELYTAESVSIRDRSDLWDFDGDKKLDGVRVFIRVAATDGQLLPATGQLKIELADPTQPLTTRLSLWEFTPTQMKANYYSGFGLDHFAFNCPLTAPFPKEILVRVTFVDALTGKQMRSETTLRPAPQAN